MKDLADTTAEFVVGFDFAFSLPAWFLSDRGLQCARSLWEEVREHGEAWLKNCDPPFWGRRGTKRPSGVATERETEMACSPVAGIRPKSALQLNGPGSVGSGSIRGMPFLAELQNAGFSVWPFDPPGWPRVVEIYPRSLTGPVHKSDPVARSDYLDRIDLQADFRELAEKSEDAFDAAISALVMSRHVESLRNLKQAASPITLLEGAIWEPTVK